VISIKTPVRCPVWASAGAIGSQRIRAAAKATCMQGVAEADETLPPIPAKASAIWTALPVSVASKFIRVERGKTWFWH
jgi:hypothetical protein